MTFRFQDLPVALTIDPIYDQIVVEVGGLTTKRASIETVWPPLFFTMNDQVGTAYTAVRTDVLSTVITMNNASANVVTIDPYDELGSDLPVGSLLIIRQIGAGSTSIAPGVGVTIQTPGTLICRVQYSMIAVLHESLNVWRLTGDYL
jgi:hypothetical protein